MKDVMAIVLAGGKGARLEPLSCDRAKPAVPFGGGYRIIDFALSNCLNSGLRRLLILTQYKALSLDRHINRSWRQYFCGELGEFIDVAPPQQRIDEKWYQGTADAVYQNIYAIEKQHPENVLILAGDHVYKMDYSEMVDHHNRTGADLTIAALQVDIDSAKSFGVMQVDDNRQVIGFDEKPKNPKTIPGTGTCLASMGVYVFSTRFLFEQLIADANALHSHRDFGKDIIPSVIKSARVMAFPFRDQDGQRQAYWRDVGTLDAYYQANMDLIDVEPSLNLYDRKWPIRTYRDSLPPPKFVFGGTASDDDRIGTALDSIVCSGSIISGGRVSRCVIGPEVRINSYAEVSNSVLFDRVQIGRRAIVRNAIIDKDVQVPEGARIGLDPDYDRKCGFTVTESGLTVIGKSRTIPSPQHHHFEMLKDRANVAKD